MYTPQKERMSSPKNLNTKFTTPNSAAAKIGRRNYFMDDEEDEDIYTFQTPVKANVNVALEVEASSTFRSRSMPRKPPPPPVSPSPKGNGMFFYSLDDDDGDIETKGFETSQLNNDEDIKFFKVKGGSPVLRNNNIGTGHARSLAKRGLTKKSDRLKCPRCGKEDFDSKANISTYYATQV